MGVCNCVYLQNKCIKNGEANTTKHHCGKLFSITQKNIWYGMIQKRAVSKHPFDCQSSIQCIPVLGRSNIINTWSRMSIGSKHRAKGQQASVGEWWYLELNSCFPLRTTQQSIAMEFSILAKHISFCLPKLVRCYKEMIMSWANFFSFSIMRWAHLNTHLKTWKRWWGEILSSDADS
jgi:hypothetical protein